MCEEKKPEDEIIKPLSNEDAWGLSDDMMPPAPDAEEKRALDTEMEIYDRSLGIVPDISKGSEIDYA